MDRNSALPQALGIFFVFHPAGGIESDQPASFDQKAREVENAPCATVPVILGGMI
jgi:hypothetical protein